MYVMFCSTSVSLQSIVVLINVICVCPAQGFAKQGQLYKAERENAERCLEDELIARDWVS